MRCSGCFGRGYREGAEHGLLIIETPLTLDAARRHAFVHGLDDDADAARFQYALMQPAISAVIFS
jgi:hypothetical protein